MPEQEQRWDSDLSGLFAEIVHNAELSKLVQVMPGMKASIVSDRFREALKQAALRSGTKEYRIEAAGSNLGSFLALLSVDELRTLARQLRTKATREGLKPFVSTPEAYPTQEH